MPGGGGQGARPPGPLGWGPLICGQLLAEPSLLSTVRPGPGQCQRGHSQALGRKQSSPFSAMTHARLRTGPEEGGPPCSQGPRAVVADTLGRRLGVSYSPGAAGIWGKELG